MWGSDTSTFLTGHVGYSGVALNFQAQQQIFEYEVWRCSGVQGSVYQTLYDACSVAPPQHVIIDPCSSVGKGSGLICAALRFEPWLRQIRPFFVEGPLGPAEV